MDHTKLLELRLPQVALFQGLSADQAGRLRDSAVVKRVENRAYIATEGELPGHLSVLLTGQVDISRTGENGETSILRRQFAPELFGYCLLAGRAFSADIVASDTCMVALLPLPLVRSILEESPETLIEAVRQLSRIVDNLTTEKIEIRDLSLINRVHKVLTRIADSSGEAAVSHEELARMAGGSRAKVSRALKTLEEQDFVVLGRKTIRLKAL